jgi:hypothetical protein
VGVLGTDLVLLTLGVTGPASCDAELVCASYLDPVVLAGINDNAPRTWLPCGPCGPAWSIRRCGNPVERTLAQLELLRDVGAPQGVAGRLSGRATRSGTGASSGSPPHLRV